VTTPDDAHLDLDALAELDEGLPSAAVAAGHQDHLASCPLCRQQLAAVRTTRALLAALPPEPMPAEVADRLDAALAGAAGTPTVVPLPPERRNRWFGRPSGAGLAAAAVVLFFLGAVVIGVTSRGGGGDTAPGGADIGALSAPEDAGPTYPIFATDATYTEANAAERVAALEQLASTGATDSNGGAATSPVRDAAQVPAQTRAMFVSSDQLLGCVAKLTAGGPAVLPVAVDFVRFTDPAQELDRSPAVAILLPRQFGSRDGVYVVGPDCATAPDQDLYLFVPAS
jgi:anti-sigma factor RsiW